MTKTLWTKDFIRITLATSLGAAGGIISGFALSFLVFDETGSTLASALVVAIQLLPGAVLPLLIAPLMDRYPRKPFLVGGDTALSICQALNVHRICLWDEVTPGMPAGIFGDGNAAGLPVVTKSGAFGDCKALSRAVEYIKKE